MTYLNLCEKSIVFFSGYENEVSSTWICKNFLASTPYWGLKNSFFKFFGFLKNIKITNFIKIWSCDQFPRFWVLNHFWVCRIRKYLWNFLTPPFLKIFFEGVHLIFFKICKHFGTPTIWMSNERGRWVDYGLVLDSLKFQNFSPIF